MLRYAIIFFVLFSVLSSKSAQATGQNPNVNGTYTGSISGVDGSCANPADDGPFSGALTLTIQADGDGNITGGNGIFVDNLDGEVETFTIDIGGFIGPTTFDFNFTLDTGGTGNLQFETSNDGNTITVNTGSATDDCITSITNGTLTRAGGGTTVVSEFTPGSSVTDALLFNIQIQNSITGISNRVTGAVNALRSFFTPRFSDNQFNMEGAMGLNAGDGIEVPYGIWGNYSYTNFENDFSSTAFDGSTHSFLGGMDFNIWKNTVMGVALGYDSTGLDTSFNGGNQDAKSYTIAPYFGWVMSDILSMDVNLGYSYVDYDQVRTAGGTSISSTPSADRFFGSLNLNAISFIDRWIIGGRVGLLYARSTIDEYTESNGATVLESSVRVGTISIAGDVAYSFNEWEPFVNLSYQYDYSLQRVVATPQPANDINDLLFTAGVRYFEKSGISGNLEYSKRFLRDNFDEDRISITLRMDY